MAQFSEWFIRFFKYYLKDLAELVKNFFLGLYYFIMGNHIKYGKDFYIATRTFQTADWIVAIPALIITLVLHIAILVLIFQLIRRYVRFVKKEQDKEDLMHEVATLNYRVSSLLDEKNAILALSGDQAPGQSAKRAAQSGYSKNRFVKLANVDEKYEYEILTTIMKEEDKIGLEELVERFINFSASQLNLYYTPNTIATFFAGMASSKTMILEGISGTGKTSLPYAMGKFFMNDSHIISVQPSWRDRAEMMGYLNEFTKKFNETDFLKAVYETTYRTDINFVVLDEMNLARVEYYFADFLSLLEMPHPSEWLIDLVPDQIASDPLHLTEGKILIPQNIWFVGTANKDDSTFTITDKVYDRASSIEMNTKAVKIDAPYTEGIHMSYEYLEDLFKNAQIEHKLSDKMLDNLIKLDQFITEKFEITFGNRIMKQLKTFIPVFVACGGEEVVGLDYFVARKIIRKFESLNLPFLQKEIEELTLFIDKMFGKNNFTECKKMLNTYSKQI